MIDIFENSCWKRRSACDKILKKGEEVSVLHHNLINNAANIGAVS